MTPPAQPLLTAAETVVGDLEAALPPGRVVVDADVARSLSRDQAAGAPAGEPAAVVRARSTEEVRRVVEICLRHRTPVVARGAGTGLSGGANAVDGCVVLSLEAMSEILDDQPAGAVGGGPAGRGQRRPSRGGGRARTVVPTRPRELAVVHARRQRRHERRRRVLRQVRRHPRVRARTRGGDRLGGGGAHRAPDRQGRRRVRPGRACSSGPRAPWASSPRSPSASAACPARRSRWRVSSPRWWPPATRCARSARRASRRRRWS